MSRNASLANRGPNDRDYRASTSAGPKFETVVRRVIDGAKGHDVTASRQVQALDRIAAASKKPAPAREHAPSNVIERVVKDWSARPPKREAAPPRTVYCHGCDHQNNGTLSRGKFRGRPGGFLICESCKGVLF